MHIKTKNRPSHHPVLSAALALALSFVLGACTNARPSNERPRSDLPAFDAKKVEQLSPQKRAALEQELFSELSLWNRSSVKYPTKADIDRREQRWLDMANEGFELAHITLQVLEPSKGRIHELQRPMKRLEQLAESGDAGAMCLMTGLVARANAKLQTDQYDPLYKKWLGRGAELGHPECQGALGARLLGGGDGYSKDLTRGMQLSIAAVKAGYIHDTGSLVLHYQVKDLEDSENLKRLYCWTVIDSKTAIFNPINDLTYSINKQSPELLKRKQAQLDELARWKPDPDDCIKLGTGETP